MTARARPQPTDQLGSLGSQGGALAAAAVRVAFALHQPAALHLVEVANQVAAVEPEAVGEHVLGERSEVRQTGQHGEVRQPQAVRTERLHQRPVTDPRHVPVVVTAVDPRETGQATGVNDRAHDRRLGRGAGLGRRRDRDTGAGSTAASVVVSER